MNNNEITAELFKLQDTRYRDFQSKLIPTINANTVIGVRSPEIRLLAKKLVKNDDFSGFLETLPHKYFDENQLHSSILTELKDYEMCVGLINKFLPYVDNWATCDQLLPKSFKKHKSELLGEIKIWIKSEHTYTIRFAVKMLMNHFLDDDFDLSYPEMVSSIQSNEYYVNMMIAWYFATALAKQYDSILPFIEQKRLGKFTHNKTIQKAVESYRISETQKEYLRQFKIPNVTEINFDD